MELWVGSYVIPIVGADLSRSISPTAFVTDSSLAGYAILETTLSPLEAADVCEVQERWCFQPPRKLACEDLREQMPLSIARGIPTTPVRKKYTRSKDSLMR